MLNVNAENEKLVYTHTFTIPSTIGSGDRPDAPLTRFVASLIPTSFKAVRSPLILESVTVKGELKLLDDVRYSQAVVGLGVVDVLFLLGVSDAEKLTDALPIADKNKSDDINCPYDDILCLHRGLVAPDMPARFERQISTRKMLAPGEVLNYLLVLSAPDKERQFNDAPADFTYALPRLKFDFKVKLTYL